MFSLNRTVLGAFSSVLLGVLKRKSTRSEESYTITTISKKNSPSKWSWLGYADVCLPCFISQSSMIWVAGGLSIKTCCIREMKFLETFPWAFLLTQLENRAMSKGYFYGLSAVWSLLCPLLLRLKHGRGSPVWPGQMGSLGLTYLSLAVVCTALLPRLTLLLRQDFASWVEVKRGYNIACVLNANLHSPSSHFTSFFF